MKGPIDLIYDGFPQEMQIKCVLFGVPLLESIFRYQLIRSRGLVHSILSR